jgi:hypothetical protein
MWPIGPGGTACFRSPTGYVPVAEQRQPPLTLAVERTAEPARPGATYGTLRQTGTVHAVQPRGPRDARLQRLSTDRLRCFGRDRASSAQ